MIWIQKFDTTVIRLKPQKFENKKPSKAGSWVHWLDEDSGNRCVGGRGGLVGGGSCGREACIGRTTLRKVLEIESLVFLPSFFSLIFFHSSYFIGCNPPSIIIFCSSYFTGPRLLFYFSFIAPSLFFHSFFAPLSFLI